MRTIITGIVAKVEIFNEDQDHGQIQVSRYSLLWELLRIENVGLDHVWLLRIG